MNENRIEEREIDLLDLLWSLLEQWRAILAVGIICALLLPLGLSLRNIGSSTEVAVEEEATKEELDNQYQAMVSVLSLYVQYKTLEGSYNNSILNKADFSNATVASSVYQVSLAEADQKLVSVESAYNDISADSEFIDDIKAIYSKDVKKGSIDDLYTVEVNTNDNEKDAATLKVKAVLPENISGDEWSKGLTQALEAYSEKISAGVGAHQLSLVSFNTKEAAGEYISTLQNNKVKMLSDARTAYNNSFAALAVENQDIIKEIFIILEEDKTDNYNIAAGRRALYNAWKDKIDEADAAATASASSRTIFSKKYVAIGFVAGVFVYAMVVAMLVVFSRKVKNAGDVEGIMKVRHYGNIYKYPYCGALAKFAHHKAVYALHKKTSDASKISADLATKLNFIGEKQVSFITLGEAGAEAEKLISGQISELKAQGIDTKTINISGTVSDMKDSDLLNLGPVFVQVISGKTTFNALLDLRDKLSEYNVTIVGTEFVEV